MCQPAFDQSGRVSHKITAWRGSNYSYRIVNFVEMTCPVFRSDKLFAFLKEYDGELVGWGIDWWYSSFLSGPHSKKFAVIDDVVVLNPHDHQRRGGAREITKLQPNHIREAMWKRKSQEKNIAEYAHRNISEIKNSDLLFMAQMDKFQLLLETETIPNRDLILSSFHVLKTEMGSILDDLSACRAEVASSKKQM